MKKTSLLLGSLLVLFLFGGCTKKWKYEHFPNIIRLVLPEDCQECAIVLHEIGINLDEEYLEARRIGDEDEPDGYSYYSYQPGASVEDNTVELYIDWSDYSPYVEPKSKNMELSIFNDIYSLSNGRERIASQEAEFKPKAIYDWDPDKGIFEDTGEKTEKLEPESSSSSSSACIVGTWSRPVDDCDNPSAIDKFTFNANGSGQKITYIVEGYDGNCQILCKVTFYYNWTYSGTTLTLDYTDVSTSCGQNPATPGSDSPTVTCSGSSISVNGHTFSK